jgi:hypothetical protein
MRWWAARNLFDIAIGLDNIFKDDKYKVIVRLTAINLTGRYALSFLSTFSDALQDTKNTDGGIGIPSSKRRRHTVIGIFGRPFFSSETFAKDICKRM